MALNTFKCNCLTPLHFKGLMGPRKIVDRDAVFDLCFFWHFCPSMCNVEIVVTKCVFWRLKFLKNSVCGPHLRVGLKGKILPRSHLLSFDVFDISIFMAISVSIKLPQSSAQITLAARFHHESVRINIINPFKPGGHKWLHFKVFRVQPTVFF